MKRSSALMMFMVFLVLGMLMEVKIAQASLASKCKEERRILINACKPVLYGQVPSPNCCYRVRIINFEKCVCPLITPKLAATVDVNRAIRFLQGCGRTVPRHYKCGGITTP